MAFHTHSIIIHSVVHKSSLFRIEEKQVALLFYSLFIRVATIGFRPIPYPMVVIFVFRNEGKLVALIVCSLFRRVATIGFRTIPYSLVVVFVFNYLGFKTKSITPQRWFYIRWNKKNSTDKAPFRMKSSVNIGLFRNGSVLNRMSSLG